MMSSASLIFSMLLVIHSTMMCCSTKEVNATFGCIAREKTALLKLKVSFSDPSNRLSSWDTSIDCCKWQGVRCDELTGHAIALDLQNNKYDDYASFYANMLSSKTIDSSILELEHLRYVDLSGNDFQDSPIPTFLGLLDQLQHLNLSHANFVGVVPHHLGNLSRLNVLDLSDEVYRRQLIVEDFVWVSRLPLLKYLDMSGVRLNGTKGVLQVLNMLPFIEVLLLSYTRLENRNLGFGYVNTSLSTIQQLDLSDNQLDGDLPYFLENMTSLRDLDLSSNNYNSCNQLHLNKVTNLVRFDLSSNSLDCDVDSISQALRNNCHMRSLELGYNSFSGDISNLFFLNSSRCADHKLATLVLSGNHFYGQLPEQIGAFRNLKLLELRYNNISGPLPTSIGSLSALAILDLFQNRLNGLIPFTIGNLRALEELVLGVNQLSGLIPSTIGNLSALTELDLSENQLNGDIPLSLWKLSNLMFLYLSGNYLDGIVSETHFSMLSKLKVLGMGNNLIKVIVGSAWIPPFQLQQLDMRSCEIVGGEFPQWLQTQKELQILKMSNCSISGSIPHWFQYIDMIALDMSHNHIEGSLPHSLCGMKSLGLLDLSNNCLSGNLLECWASLSDLSTLKLSSNFFTGVIPNSIGKAYSLEILELSNNNLTGEVPATLRNCTQLQVLDLSRNGLSGHLPGFWDSLSMLSACILSSNQLSGVIPNSIGGACSLEWLQLSDNRFTGELPSNLRNCTQLIFLDVGENSLSGELPKWIGNNLRSLKVLRLRNNEFYGMIPYELCQLSWLQIVDLACNEFAQSIPHCFGDLFGMVSYNFTGYWYTWGSVHEVIKGVVREYFTTLPYMVNMDLSNNNLAGEIPSELTKLAILLSLNLSHNHLQGNIPMRIGDIKWLESLDLSNNNLSGNIPVSLSYLTSLNHLNLSHNNLRGEIPTGRQLQTLEDPSIYEANAGLCGSPLLKKCRGDKASSVPTKNHLADVGEDKVDLIWFCGVVISGFATGFWGVVGVLVFNRRSRDVYFRFVDGITSRIDIYVH